MGRWSGVGGRRAVGIFWGLVALRPRVVVWLGWGLRGWVVGRRRAVGLWWRGLVALSWLVVVGRGRGRAIRSRLVAVLWWGLVLVFILGRWLWLIGGRLVVARWSLTVVRVVLGLVVFCRRQIVVDRWLVWRHVTPCRLVLVRLGAHRRPEVVDYRVLAVVRRVPVVGIRSGVGGRVGDGFGLDDVLDVAGVGGNLDAGDLHSRVPWRGAVDHWPAVVVDIVPVKVWSLETSRVIYAIK